MAWPTIALALMLIVSAALLLVATRSDKVPLLADSQWVNADDFLVLRPDRLNSHLSQGIIDKSPGLFINVSPDWKTKVGRLESRPFVLPEHFVVPLRGLVFSVGGRGTMTFSPTGGSVVLVCLGNGRTIELLNSPSQDWFERAVSVPKFWCATEAKLVATVTDPDIFLGVGTPFKVTRAYAAVAGSLSWLVAFGVASIVFLALFVPPLLINRLTFLTRTSISLLILGGFGFVSYVLQALNAPRIVIVAFTIIMILLPSVGSAIAVAVLGRSANSERRTVERQGRWLMLSRMSLVWLILGVFYVVPLAAIPTHSGSWTVNYAFYPVSWSTDNQLPLAMARYVMETDLVQPPGLGPWSVTDRGFVPAGVIAGGLTALNLLGLEKDNPISYLVAQTIIALANAGVLLLLVHLPSVARFSCWRLAAVTAIISTSPFFFFNVLYAWPKIAAGTAALWSIMTLFSALRQGRYPLLWLPAPLFAVAMLFHSGILFLLPIIVLYAGFQFVRLRKQGLVDVSARGVLALAASSAIGLSLVAYHNSFGTQSSYGTTIVLTGRGVFGLSSADLANLLMQYYAKLTFVSYLGTKWEQFSTMFWPFVGFGGEFDDEKSFLARLRMAGFFSAVPALSLFPIIILSFRRLQMAGRHYDFHLIREGALVSSVTVACLFIGAALPFLVHHLPYTFLLSFLLWGTLVANFDLVAVRVLAAIHVAAFLVVWPIGSWWIWSTHFSSGMP